MTNKTIVGIVAAAVLTLVGLGGYHQYSAQAPSTVDAYAHKSVRIVNMAENSGGTGVILDSGPAGSKILTNKHVCELIQVGGVVIDDSDNKYSVKTYQPYTPHDLCLITVSADLKQHTDVAKKAPAIYSSATVTGHPALLPSIITTGHFSKIQDILIMVGVKPCTGQESGDDAMACFFLGGIPIIKQLSAQVTSALIMPGSSGSGVFNSRGELSGLVFAGMQGIGFGFIVPHSFVADFLANQDKYEVKVPDAKKKPSSLFADYHKFVEMCAKYRNGYCTGTKRAGTLIYE